MRIIHSIVYIAAASIFLLSCAGEQDTKSTIAEEPIKTSYPTLPEWAINANIYEVNTRQYTDDANFKGVESHMTRLHDMGVDILWMMPIHPISLTKRKAKGDLLVADIKDPEEQKLYQGSPYAVADYKAVNPDFGTMEDFKSLITTAHANNMKIIIDWVPNHTGWDNPWITEHPEWYTKDSIGNITDPINYETGESWGWTDVADLDYNNQEMRLAMIDALKFWTDEIGVDGFRVDVAHGIEQGFWDQVRDSLSGRDIFMLAESEVPSHRNSGAFHMDYGWSFHHILNDIAKGEKNVTDIKEWLIKNRETYQKGFHMQFTTNHDENAWAGTEMDRMGDAHQTFAVLTATFEGMPLIYSGQEEPLTERLAFFSQQSIGFKNYAYADFYKKLLNLKHNNQALWNGEYGGKVEIISDSNEVLAYKREKNDDKVITIINLSKSEQIVTLTEDSGMLTNVFSNEKAQIAAGEPIKMKPWEYIVLANKM